MRIKELRKSRGIKQIELCKYLGISQGNLSNWENDVYEPDKNSLIRMAEFFGVSVDYLLGVDETRPMPENIYPITPYTKLPKLGVIRAGSPISTDQGYDDWGYADLKYGDGNHFMLDVDGDSMSPTIPNGATAIIRRQDYAENGDIVAFAMDGEYATLKRYFEQPNGDVVLRGDNPTAQCYVITPSQIKNNEAFIIGVAVEYKAKLKR